MNNRFKFRAWDETIKSYWKGSTVQLSSDGQPFIIDGNMQPQDIDNVIIEQCTGVKDKTGKLIYEGDIIHIYLEADNGMVINRDIVVEWDDYNCNFDFWQDPECVSEYGEIIGNIHESEGKDE